MSERQILTPKPISLNACERIDALCLGYEDCWMQGADPKLESYLEQVPAPDRPALVYELLRIDLAYGGARREVLTEAAYRTRLPEYQDVVRAVFARRPSSAIRNYVEGERLGRFLVQRELGRGGFGAVFLARDPQLERFVALKTIRSDLVSDVDARRQLLDEAMLAAQLSHPGIATLYGVEQDLHGEPLLAYQYIEGESLRSRLQRDISVEHLAALIRDIALAVDHAHQAGVVHRDLQPNNVLLDANADGRPVITDFGLATHLMLRPAEPGEIAGAPAYLAPEQTRGDAEQLDARVDIWALGVMLYEGLTGLRPFAAPTSEDLFVGIQKQAPLPPRQIRAEIPRALEAICLKCLEKSPHDRYSTAADLAAELDHGLDECRGDRRRWLLATLAAAPLALAVAAGGGLLFAPEKSLGSIQLTPLVKRAGFWAEVGSARAPLVLSGDAMRLQVRLEAPAHLYLVWIDVHGDASPIYPWKDGSWAPQSEGPTDALQLPEALDAFWEMEIDRPGAETVMVLARRDPLPPDLDIRAAFADLPAQPPIPSDSVVQFVNGHIDLSGPRSRAPEWNDVRYGDHKVAVTQRLLFERLRKHFLLVQACCIPVHP